LAIEAALASRRSPPGLHRAFAFENFPSYDARAYAAERREAEKLALPTIPAPIWASDLNAGALGTARRNAGRAAVLEDLRLFRHDATRPIDGLPTGTMAIANLPYGKRVGGDDDLPALYRALVSALRRAGVARAAFLTAAPEAIQWLGLERAEVHRVENGGLPCRLLVARL